MNTPDRLAEIKQRLAGTSPGPWTLNPAQFTCDCGPGFDHKGPEDCPTGWYDQAAWVDGPTIIEYGDEFGGFCNADADFMAQARQDIPWLIAELERLYAAFENAQALLLADFEPDEYSR